MYGYFYICMSLYQVPSVTHRGQKKALDSLDLELQMVVSRQ